AEGIELANEYVSKRLLGFDDKNPFYPEWMAYRVFENNKETIGSAYLNNMYGFDGVPQDRKLPNELAGRPLTNNVMENLLDRKAFSVVYGYPLEDWKENGKEPRYLGRSIWGQKFSNMFFPPDNTSSTAYIEDRNWVKEPWRYDEIRNQFGVREDEFHYKRSLIDPNYQKRLEKLIIKGIEYKIEMVAEDSKAKGYNNYFRSRNEGYKNMGDDLYWFNRVVIIQPPTKYTWGLGVIYHKSGGKYWYMDMYIHPDTLIDLDMKVELKDKYIAIMDDEEDKSDYVTIENAVVDVSLDTELIFGTKQERNVDVYISDVLDFKAGFRTSATNTTTGNQMDIIVEGGIDGIEKLSERELKSILQLNKGVSLNTTLKIPKNNLKQGNNKIKLMADGSIEIKDEGEAKDTAEKIIEIFYIKSVKTSYMLDYDEYTKTIIHPFNKGDALTATLTKPFHFDRWIGDARIRFAKTDSGTGGLVFGSPALKDVPTSVNSSSTAIYPKIEFKAGREFLGDNPPGVLYHPNGETMAKSFIQQYQGELSRDYKYLIKNVEPIPDESGSGTARDSFPAGHEQITIKAKVYNGTEMTPQSIAKGEENTGSALIKKLYWEGNRYEIPVQRYMKNVGANGNIASLTPADGKFKRLFQHKDTVQVTYGVNKSMAQHFAKDRKASKEGRTKSFDYAPFATDKVLQNLPYPLRSGYNYAPYGQYTATVRTEIYKKGGEQTEHQAIVNSVINSFKVNVELPTLNSKGQKVNTYPINVAKNTKLISDEVLKYNAGPSGVGDYGSANESALLGSTNDLFKKILEGWSYSGTQSSWLDKKYREYVKSADIHKITEETIITFTVNPKLEKFLTPIEIGGKNIPDGDYFIRVYFNGFENCHANKVVSSALNPQSSWSKKYNPNDPWNMVINIRGTRHDDMIY
ncbi:MAG: hypothetical protein GX992_07115, partial [Clostridium sp.]|nr:hypothetical protein [Clostridium sp.]